MAYGILSAHIGFLHLKYVYYYFLDYFTKYHVFLWIFHTILVLFDPPPHLPNLSLLLTHFFPLNLSSWTLYHKCPLSYPTLTFTAS